jgi:hypothetical protein
VFEKVEANQDILNVFGRFSKPQFELNQQLETYEAI